MVDRPFFGGAVYTYIHIYIVIRADNTLLQSPPPPIFSRGRGRATRARASLSDFLPSALLPLFHIIYIRVAVPLTSSPLGIPIRKRHLRRDTSDFGGACEGHAVRMSRRGRQMLDRATPYSERNECRRTLGPLAARWLSFDCFLKNAIGKLK